VCIVAHRDVVEPKSGMFGEKVAKFYCTSCKLKIWKTKHDLIIKLIIIKNHKLNLLSLINLSFEIAYYRTTLSNHGLMILNRYVSQFHLRVMK
jgi:hypothetical protein